MEKTFYYNRRCQLCGIAIPDQAHGLRKFCEPIEMEDGSIRDCKSDFHAQERSEEMEPYNEKILAIRNADRALAELKALKGPIVTIDDIDRAGLQLEGYATLTRNDKANLEFRFLHYSLTYFSNKTFKIIHHETR
ncbi:MAG: hypothetical protein EOO69_12800 [Moraxellaceae bacterium]|nr:MAG: hypothetical protein EOO69_12800 [Moraxellaceae bacterium]